MSDHRRRERYRIVIDPGLWRDVEVAIEPPTITHELRSFKTHAEALAYAAELSRVEGWPVTDRVRP